MGAYLVYGFACVILITSLPLLAIGIYFLSTQSRKIEGRESGWPHLLQGAYGFLEAIFLAGVYHYEYLDAQWSIILTCFLSLPLGLYRIWKIRRQPL